MVAGISAERLVPGRRTAEPVAPPPRVLPPGESMFATAPRPTVVAPPAAPAAPLGWGDPLSPDPDDVRATGAFRWVPPEPLRRAGWLAGVLYLLTAAAAAAQAFALAGQAHRVLLLALAVGTAATGVVLMRLPWADWPEWATLLPVVWGLAGFAVVIANVTGWSPYFLPLYAVAFLYIGLTQPPGTALLMTGPAALAAGATVLGRQPLAALPDLLITIGVGAAVGELLAILRSRQEAVRGGLEQVIDVAAEMLDCETAPALVVYLTERTRTVLGADGVMMLLADPADPAVYLSQAVSLRDPHDPAAALVRHPVLLDVYSRPTGVGTAVRGRQPVFVPSGPRPAALAELPGLDVASAIYVPMVGRYGVPGVVIAWWTREHRRLEPAATRMVGLLGRQAAPVLERMRTLAVLETEASTDPLTGLANRRTFRAALSGLPEAGAVAMLDLDHFKQLNDRFGHAVGDKALTAFAGVLAEELRVADCAARYGGEEFAIALRDEYAAVRALDRLRKRWSEISGICLPARYRITFSAGIATRRRGETPDELLARADAALYRAKATGRDRTVLDGSAPTGPTVLVG